MKTLNEYLVKSKISSKGNKDNKFGYTMDDLDGRRLVFLKDIKKGMYVKIVSDYGSRGFSMWALVSKIAAHGVPVPGLEDQPVMLAYASIIRHGKCRGFYDTEQPLPDKNIVGLNYSTVFMMDKDDYEFFHYHMERNGIDIPDEFKLN